MHDNQNFFYPKHISKNLGNQGSSKDQHSLKRRRMLVFVFVVAVIACLTATFSTVKTAMALFQNKTQFSVTQITADIPLNHCTADERLSPVAVHIR